jgi:pyruvate dehydrogenase E2 component (dihydrolipoamide acetyltransferase)
MSEPTFTLSNLGMFGVTNFTAILNPPQVGILATGSAIQRPMVEEGEVVVRTMMTMTLSADHRAVDGATGARFLGAVRSHLQQAGTGGT